MSLKTRVVRFLERRVFCFSGLVAFACSQGFGGATGCGEDKLSAWTPPFLYDGGFFLGINDLSLFVWGLLVADHDQKRGIVCEQEYHKQAR